jgi:hypothetical protein
LAAVDETVMDFERELEALGDRGDLQDKKNEVSAEIKSHKAKISTLNVGYILIIGHLQLIPSARMTSRAHKRRSREPTSR